MKGSQNVPKSNQKAREFNSGGGGCWVGGSGWWRLAAAAGGYWSAAPSREEASMGEVDANINVHMACNTLINKMPKIQI